MLKARHTSDCKLEAGIDEAGRGCLWGPLVAAAVVWPEEIAWTEEVKLLSESIKDSKQLSSKRRAVLEAGIKTHAIAWAVGRVEASEIDMIGMTKSNRLAFQRALEGLSIKPGRILIDGVLGLLPEHAYGIEQVVEAKGDGTYLAIAAASILAKEGRDTIVKGMCELEPALQIQYALLSSKGYGTLKHRTAIKEHGIHAQHRKLFLRKLLGLEHTVQEDLSKEYMLID